MRLAGWLIIFAILLGLLGWYEYLAWSECLGKNSFLFCFRILV